MMKDSVLLYIAGIAGCVGSTVAAGVSAWRDDVDLDPGPTGLQLGLVTEATAVKSLDLRLPRIDSLIVGGWDIKDGDLELHAGRHGICPPNVLQAVGPILRGIRPRTSFPIGVPLRDWILSEAATLKRIAGDVSAGTTILVNLCPTEPCDLQVDDAGVDWEALDFDSATAGVTPSRIFFRLAIEAGAQHLNFTPNQAETETLRTMALRQRLLFCGRDGKTGQTFLKTVLAPALRDRHLYISGWYSTNLLGNSDGQALTSSDALLAKQRSKSQCLASILGYSPGERENAPGSHQVHIHFYPPRHDAKEAWDNIDFQGFLGHRMQLKLNWLGQDSILAAPAVIDLARLLTALRRAGRHGAASELSYFFKDPLSGSDRKVEHSTPEQYRRLIGSLTNGGHSPTEEQS